MKRIVLYCIILGALLVVPVEKLDVGDLEPVQAVWVYQQEGQVVLETDTQDRGDGNTVEEALADLKTHCKGIIYLDTAQFLLVAEDTADRIPALTNHLKGKVKVCQWDGEGSVADAAKYMAAHKTGRTLKAWKQGEKLPAIHLKNTK